MEGTEARIVQIAKEEWEKLDWENIYEFIASPPRRIQVILSLDGERTKY